jgi:polyvinyl alcohol dehydrogenase (cytochrome)
MLMLKRICLLLIAVPVLRPVPFAGAQQTQAAGPETGKLYSQNCAKCHDPHEGTTHATDRTTLAQMVPEAIYRSLTTGSMAANAKALKDGQKREIAEFLSGRPLGGDRGSDASAMKNHCPGEPLDDPFKGPMWNGWGADLTNSRFQPTAEAGLTATQIPHLKFKWAFGFPNTASASAQPTVVGGRVYVGSSNGFVYALSAASGCVYWSFEAKGAVRSAITMGPPIKGSSPAQYPLYFGDVKANVFAVDAATGKLLWTQRADSIPGARITAAPKLFEERLYVPVSSWEATARGPDSECCKFRGSVVAYDANTGQQIWKAYTIADEPQPIKKTETGVQQWGPSGGGVWGSPTIDPKRRTLYVGTGDSYTPPTVNTVDAVLAFDLASGKMLWSRQLTQNDVADAPDSPDFDIGASAILRTLPDGRSILVVSSKSGVTYALDPDQQGKQLWEQRVGEGSRRGGTMWGSAADEEVVYVPNVDTQLGPDKAGGLTALRLDTGKKVWHVMPPVPDCKVKDESCAPGQSAAVTLIPGAVFSGSTNGVMRAFSTADGRVLWQFSASGEPIMTVNGVAGQGGSINGAGPTVVGGMVFMNSGYGYGGGTPGNLLLAFGVD